MLHLYTFYKILENASKFLHALQNDRMHFAKNLCIFYATYKTTFWYSYKIFHARDSLLHAIRNWVVVLIYSFTDFFMTSSNLDLGQLSIIIKSMPFQRFSRRMFVSSLKCWRKKINRIVQEPTNMSLKFIYGSDWLRIEAFNTSMRFRFNELVKILLKFDLLFGIFS